MELQTNANTFEQLPHIAQHLEHLVGIASSTQNILGVYKIQREIEFFLEKLGFEISYFPHPTHQSAPLLLGTLNNNHPTTVSFILHADTVIEPTESFKFSADQSKLYGPGVADDKGGIVVALQALRLFLTQEELNFNIQFISSPSEEIGSPGFHSILKNLGAQSDIILGFEPSLPDGSLISSRNGNRWYDIKIQGREAHSGRCSGEELNAALELSHKILRIHEISQIIPGAKAHIGHIHAGRDKFNVVCGHAHAKLDTRFDSFESREHLHLQIDHILSMPFVTSNIGDSTQTSYIITDDCPPMSTNHIQQKFCHFLSSQIQNKERRIVSCKHSGGAADINYMSHKSAICIDGLGPVGGNLHTEHEYIEIDSLTTRTEMVFEFLKYINGKEAL